MEGRTMLCFLVLLVLLATPATLAGRADPATTLAADPATLKADPATLKADKKCFKSRFHSLICMDWQCRMECQNNHPDELIYEAFCTVKHLVVRYCNCLVCAK